MPIHEYLLPDGSKTERFFFPTETVPERIVVTVTDDNGDPVQWEGKKVVSRPVVKFKGAFSGGTASKHLVHKDDGSVVEPGRLKDVKRTRQEVEAKREAKRREHIEAQLADYAV